MDAKGQGLLQDIAAWDRVAPHCAEVVGRVDWVPGSDEPQEVDFIDKFGYSIQVIQRDCLTALLREEIEDKYQDKIRLVYNTECKAITWGVRPGDPVRLEMQETRRIHPKGEASGARPTVEVVGAPTITMADFVVGADGANSRVRDAMEADAEPEEVRLESVHLRRRKFTINPADAERPVLLFLPIS
jgi:2-polyprenyl-6-methoxyphenol hydroxylase-like FAD-dependent oxidoreductase